MRKTTEYPNSHLEQRIAKNNQGRAEPRRYQKQLEAMKARHENQKGTYRKHNSPDYQQYRSSEENQAPRTRPGRPRKEEEGTKKEKELIKNSSSPAFDMKALVQEQNQDFKRLHDKLNLIQNKIADMKRHVQKKREEKAQLLEARKQRERQREAQLQANASSSSNSNNNNNSNNHNKADLRQFVSSIPEHKQLHTFEKNPYSPNHNVYYVSEIIKSYKDEKSLGREHLLTSLHIFKVLENSRFANDEEMRQRMVHLERKKGTQGKKTVVFDLDQTLIHCNDTLTPPYDVKLPITFPTGEIIQAGINIRPYAQQILKTLSRHFQIIVFTASHSCYANVVLDYLDPSKQYIQHRLFREHCYQTPEGMYCKDLRVLDRDLSEVVLVDNAAYSYAAQPDNGIPILPYYHGKADYQLKALERYLLTMVMVDDVRQTNRQTFQFHLYRNYYSSPERLVEQLYMNEQK